MPDLVLGEVFDRVVAKVNSEIITLSSVQERVEILKQKYKWNYSRINVKIEKKELETDLV